MSLSFNPIRYLFAYFTSPQPEQSSPSSSSSATTSTAPTASVSLTPSEPTPPLSTSLSSATAPTAPAASLYPALSELTPPLSSSLSSATTPTAPPASMYPSLSALPVPTAPAFSAYPGAREELLTPYTDRDPMMGELLLDIPIPPTTSSGCSSSSSAIPAPQHTPSYFDKIVSFFWWGSSTSSISTVAIPRKISQPTATPNPHPHRSYLHLAFRELSAESDGAKIFCSLPIGSKLDSLRHIQTWTHVVKSTPERFPLESRILKWTQSRKLDVAKRIPVLERAEKSNKRSLSPERRREGEALLRFYYSNKDLDVDFYAELLRRIEKFASEDKRILFCYLQEQTKNAGWDDFPSQWDRDPRFNHPEYFLHMIQAIERYLHADQ